MIELLFFLLTPLLFFVFKQIQKVLNVTFANPILLSILVIAVGLYMGGGSYIQYQAANVPFTSLLELAIVALAIPLYNEFETIKKDFLNVLLCVCTGVITSSTVAITVAYLLGASDQLIATVAPNAVTTPIAITVATNLGGIAPLSAVIVICVGIVGAIIAIPLLTLFKSFNSASSGLAIGVACHAIGTARALEYNAAMGAYASTSLILSTVLTPLLLPAIFSIFKLVSGF